MILQIWQQEMYSTVLPFLLHPFLVSFTSSSDKALSLLVDSLIELDFWLSLEIGKSSRGQTLSLPASSVLNSNYHWTFSFFWKIGLRAAANVLPLIYVHITYCDMSHSAINIPLHMTPITTLKDSLHDPTARPRLACCLFICQHLSSWCDWWQIVSKQ